MFHGTSVIYSKINERSHVSYIGKSYIYTLWLLNIAMENGPNTDEFPIKTSINNGFSIAMLNNQMVDMYIYIY